MNKRLMVNGEERTVMAQSIRELLSEIGLGLDPKGIAVAVDGQVVPRSQWDRVEPVGGAEIEIVGAVQGG
jgi:sulfur carrier protein